MIGLRSEQPPSGAGDGVWLFCARAARALAFVGMSLVVACAPSYKHQAAPIDPVLAPPHGGAVAAQNPLEAALLAQAGALETGTTTVVEGFAVVAGPIYDAASGRPCRKLTVAETANVASPKAYPSSSDRLVCASLGEASAWFFAPPVLADAP